MDLTRTVLNNYTVVWGAALSRYDFGAVDKVTVGGAIKTKEIKVGSVGDVVLGQRIVGLEPKITLAVREVDLALLQKIHPWWVSGAIGMLPAAVQQDLYAYAQVLTLHPNHLAAGVVTQDRNFLKAVPMPSDSSRDGVADGAEMVDFWCFPDRAQLPALVYGYIGAVPA